MGPIWGLQDPGGPHVDPTNFAIWVSMDGEPKDNVIDVSILSTPIAAPFRILYIIIPLPNNGPL